jgi:DNA modification methylase|tara:strand:- start:1963 stop:2883 length:921 start_codon:yes stop_codon:yes gene_type:complete
MSWDVVTGHTLEVLAGLDAKSVQTVVTSPPYYGLRDYGDDGQDWPEVTFSPMPGLPSMTIDAQRAALGLESDPWAYVGHMVAVFREVRRVLRDDGTLWLNLGDSFKNKQLQGIPWRVAYALQADGWYLRSDIIWSKPNPMPSSVSDRCTTSHEYIYLLTKKPKYYYNADAIAEDSIHAGKVVTLGPKSLSKAQATGIGTKPGGNALVDSVTVTDKRNARSVWTITTRPYPEAHFAVFPTDIPERCIKASSRPGDVVLDPFSGAGTTGMVARRLQRSYIGAEQSETYAEMSRRRIESDAPLFNRGLA